VSNSTSVNSCGEFGTPVTAHCGCCHAYTQVKPHWDYPVMVCEPCHQLLFTFEAHGALAHTAYQFSLRLERGAL